MVEMVILYDGFTKNGLGMVRPIRNVNFDGCVAVVNGCTDATAFNYNSEANTDDGSCVAVVNGCTDSSAFNYAELANTDDGSCVAVVNGCTDSTAFNYSELANTDDGSCVAVVYGCIDSTAFNYSTAANTDDGSCVAVVYGCIDSSAFNYSSAANTDDGSCVEVVYGCIDSTAFNYSTAANTDNDSCVPVIIGCMDSTAFDYNPNANTPDMIIPNVSGFELGSQGKISVPDYPCSIDEPFWADFTQAFGLSEILANANPDYQLPCYGSYLAISQNWENGVEGGASCNPAFNRSYCEAINMADAINTAIAPYTDGYVSAVDFWGNTSSFVASSDEVYAALEIVMNGEEGKIVPQSLMVV